MENSYALSAWFFTRALCLVYIVAFLSLAVQAKGLWGSRGILPVSAYSELAAKQLGKARHWKMPSVFWMVNSDHALVGAALVGALAAGLAFFGIAQGYMLLIAFALYLSFLNAGQDFMGFQWDALLCEVGFLALFAVPWSFKYSLNHALEPHWLVRAGFYVVLFKLMFLSGVVKILSGDPSWRDFTALTYHYWTQPLPNPLSPFAHALPRWFHQGSTVLTFVIELFVPFLIFVPRVRPFVALAFVGLSVLILITGNYTFFNWLTIALCFWLIPDSWWNGLAERLPLPLEILPSAPHITHATAFVVGIPMMISVLWCVRFWLPDAVLAWINPVLRYSQSLHLSNPYGLFANMTKARPELSIEGTLDGKEWREYVFKYKPGPLYRRPPLVAPHQPRLDWQMWFAALSPGESRYWLESLMGRLKEGSPDVLALLDHDPFNGVPPKDVRVSLQQYEFTSPGDIWEHGQWWRRK